MNSHLKTFCFAKEIVDQYKSLVVSSLDVDSSLTNIPLDETLDICTNTIYNNTNNPSFDESIILTHGNKKYSL